MHLKKSMQALSDALEDSLKKKGVNIVFEQKVNSINFDDVKKSWKVCATSNQEKMDYYADDVIYTPPPQSLLKHLENTLDKDHNYKKRIQSLPDPSGALVFYSALKKEHIKVISSNPVSYTHLTLPTIYSV